MSRFFHLPQKIFFTALNKSLIIPLLQRRRKTEIESQKNFFSHLVGSENAILSRLKCKHFMNPLLSALSVLQKSPHLVGSENTILSGSDTKLFHFCMVEQNSRAIFVNSSK